MEVIKKDINNKLTNTNYIITSMKVFATILVVYIHGFNIFGYAGLKIPTFFRPFMTIATAAVPVFMLVSAFLLFGKEINWFENLKKKTKRLAIPFLIWSCFWIIMEAIGHVVLPDKFKDVFGWNLTDWLLNIFGIPFSVKSII